MLKKDSNYLSSDSVVDMNIVTKDQYDSIQVSKEKQQLSIDFCGNFYHFEDLCEIYLG